MMQGKDVCRWCEADFYRDGRCWRCGQPERTCNEVAGRAFRMTWDDRSDYGLWGNAEDDAWPRSPSFRVETATRRMRWRKTMAGLSLPWMPEPSGFALPSIRDIVARQRDYLTRATGIPAGVLFGEMPPR